MTSSVDRELRFLTLLRRWALEYTHDKKLESQHRIYYILDFHSLFPYLAPYNFHVLSSLPKEMADILFYDTADIIKESSVESHLEALIFSSAIPFLESDLSKSSAVPEPYKLEILSFLHSYKDDILKFTTIDAQDPKTVAAAFATVEQTLRSYDEAVNRGESSSKVTYDAYKALLDPIPGALRWIADPKNSPASRMRTLWTVGLLRNFSEQFKKATEEARRSPLHGELFSALRKLKKRTPRNLAHDVDALALVLQLNLERKGAYWCFVTGDETIHGVIEQWFSDRSRRQYLPAFPFLRHPLQFSPLFRLFDQRVQSMDSFVREFSSTYDTLFRLNAGMDTKYFELWQSLVNISHTAGRSTRTSPDTAFARLVASLSKELRNRIIDISVDAATRRALELDVKSTDHAAIAEIWTRIARQNIDEINNILMEGLKIQSNMLDRSIELVAGSVDLDLADSSEVFWHFDAVKYLYDVLSNRRNSFAEKLELQRSPWYFMFTPFQNTYIQALASGDMGLILTHFENAIPRARAACAMVNACVLGLRGQWAQSERILENIANSNEASLFEPRRDEVFSIDEALITYALVLRYQTDPGEDRFKKAAWALEMVKNQNRLPDYQLRAKFELCVLELSRFYHAYFYGAKYEAPKNILSVYEILQELAGRLSDKAAEGHSVISVPFRRRLYANLCLFRLFTSGVEPQINDLRMTDEDAHRFHAGLKQAIADEPNRSPSLFLQFILAANAALLNPDDAADQIKEIERIRDTGSEAIVPYDRRKIDDFLAYWQREHR